MYIFYVTGTCIIVFTYFVTERQPRAKDTITTKKDASKTEVNDIVERLNTTYPECQQDKKPPVICTNSVSRDPATEDEIKVA